MNKVMTSISSFFKFSERGTTFKKELIGGLSTFLAMAYILAVNPGMLDDATGGAGYTGAFFLATAIMSMVATLAMGLFANVPIALAPGMGINAFFAYTVGGVMGFTAEQALICVFFAGILFFITAVTPLRKYVVKIFPRNMKIAIGAMIGLFIAFIGLQDANIIVSDSFGVLATDPVTNLPIVDANGHNIPIAVAPTSVKLGNFSDPLVIIAFITIMLALILHFMKVAGAALWAMAASVAMIAIAYACGVDHADKAFVLNNYNSFGTFDDLAVGMWSSIGSTLSNGKAYIAIFVFLYMNFFDAQGTLYVIGHQAKLEDKDSEKWMSKANIVAASSATVGAAMGSSTVTPFVESSAGVSQGARTGFSSVIVALLFGLSIAAWPIMSPIMPITDGAYQIAPVTGAVQVLVGVLMVSQLKHFDWAESLDIPTLLITIVFGMLSYNIATGISAGTITYVLLNASAWGVQTIQTKRGKHFTTNEEEIVMTDKVGKVGRVKIDYKSRVMNPAMIVIFLLAVTYFATTPLWMY